MVAIIVTCSMYEMFKNRDIAAAKERGAEAQKYMATLKDTTSKDEENLVPAPEIVEDEDKKVAPEEQQDGAET